MTKILQTLKIKDLQSVKIRSFNDGQIIFNEGDKCEYLGIVKEGKIKISSFTYSGNEIIYRELEEGDVFGNNLIFSSEPIYRGDVIAVGDTVVFLIKKESLLEILQTNLELLNEYLTIQSEQGKRQNLNIKLLTFENADDRVLYYLSVHGESLTYKSISDLANKLFLTREATSRSISRLKERNIIKVVGKTIKKQN